MPELPEVESVRRTLLPRVVGRTVATVTVHRRDVVIAPGDPPGGFGRAPRSSDGAPPKPRRLSPAALLHGDRVVELRRRGKQLAIAGASGRIMLVHLGMTGQLFWEPASALRSRGVEPHTHIVWQLATPASVHAHHGNGSPTVAADAGQVVFRDPRRFGGVWLLPDAAALETRWQHLGPDALTIQGSQLGDALAATRRCIKAALLDQAVLAGVGNIYADEALFLSGIHPGTPARSLRGDAVDRLAAAIRQVLHESVEAGGSTLRDYVDGDGEAGSYQLAHRVYGRGGEPCLACGGVLKACLLAQRTTVLCPACQPRRRSISTRSSRPGSTPSRTR